MSFEKLSQKSSIKSLFIIPRSNRLLVLNSSLLSRIKWWRVAWRQIPQKNDQNKIAEILFLLLGVLLKWRINVCLPRVDMKTLVHFHIHRKFVNQTRWRFTRSCLYSFPFFFSTAKLDRCPMCRAPINSYFCIRGEEYVPANAETRAPKSKAAINWIDALNDRLTDFLGFR